uniref:ACB domain-containing protein n=1 Tax=Globisporangium ultimum (strain ATCC 200006 / CBS 805.95 / DAOM BR144) TaxID=431595 RepID=K3WML8_GLOUD
MAERRREEESSLHGYEYEFTRAAEQLKAEAARGRVFVSDSQKIKLYALYKQATEGDCAKPQPRTDGEACRGWKPWSPSAATCC